METATTRYVAATAFGGPEALELLEERLPEPGPGQVLLEVRAAGVNPIDTKMYAGPGDPSELPMRLGFEAAGVVSAVGPGVDHVSVGQGVIAFRVAGAYAERLLVEAGAVLPKPEALPFEEAAGLMLTGATAVHVLAATEVGEGDTVLVHAATGGVGRMAVQLARLRGASVVGTAGAGHLADVLAMGARPVEYGPGLADRVRAAAPDGVDVALDLVGTDEAVDVSLALLPDRKRFVTIAAFARAESDGIRVLGGPGEPGQEIRDAARPELARLAGDGRLRVLVSARYPLAEAAEAHRVVAGGHTRGKVVLVTGRSG